MEKGFDFDEKMIMKEKRRTSMSKGKKIYDKTKIKNSKAKQRKMKNIKYDPYFSEEYYE